MNNVWKVALVLSFCNIEATVANAQHCLQWTPPHIYTYGDYRSMPQVNRAPLVIWPTNAREEPVNLSLYREVGFATRGKTRAIVYTANRSERAALGSMKYGVVGEGQGQFCAFEKVIVVENYNGVYRKSNLSVQELSELNSMALTGTEAVYGLDGTSWVTFTPGLERIARDGKRWREFEAPGYRPMYRF